jgi:hypothetical protein
MSMISDFEVSTSCEGGESMLCAMNFTGTSICNLSSSSFSLLFKVVLVLLIVLFAAGRSDENDDPQPTLMSRWICAAKPPKPVRESPPPKEAPIEDRTRRLIARLEEEEKEDMRSKMCFIKPSFEIFCEGISTAFW